MAGVASLLLGPMLAPSRRYSLGVILSCFRGAGFLSLPEAGFRFVDMVLYLIADYLHSRLGEFHPMDRPPCTASHGISSPPSVSVRPLRSTTNTSCKKSSKTSFTTGTSQVTQSIVLGTESSCGSETCNKRCYFSLRSVIVLLRQEYLLWLDTPRPR